MLFLFYIETVLTSMDAHFLPVQPCSKEQSEPAIKYAQIHIYSDYTDE